MSGGMTSAEKTLRLSDAVRALTKVAKAAEVRCECTDICAAQIRGARAMLNLTQPGKRACPSWLSRTWNHKRESHEKRRFPGW